MSAKNKKNVNLKNNSHATNNSKHLEELNKMKYEIANEFGVSLSNEGKVKKNGNVSEKLNKKINNNCNDSKRN